MGLSNAAGAHARSGAAREVTSDRSTGVPAQRAARAADLPAIGQRRRTRVYYASDIHGTEGLWRKFLNAAEAYRAGVIVMGGDVAGKVVVPLLERPEGGYELELFGRRELLAGEQQLQEAEARIRANGMYPHRMSAAEAVRVAELPEAERESWFAQVMLETFERWLALADERLEGQRGALLSDARQRRPAGDRRGAGASAPRRGVRRADRRVRRL